MASSSKKSNNPKPPPISEEDKIRLMKAKSELVRSLDVQSVLPHLRKRHLYSKEDEAEIMKDPRRRERMVVFIDLLMKKNGQTFQAFSDLLEAKFPHLFLLLSDWEADDDDLGGLHRASGSHLRDEWSVLQHNRSYLIAQIDAGRIAAELKAKKVLSSAEEKQITSDPLASRRTEIFLDILEMKPKSVFPIFVESLSDVYPHVYLALSNDDTNDDW